MVLTRAVELGPRDHVCWAYAGASERRERVVEFLLEGLDQGQQIAYVAPSTVDAMMEELRGIGELERLVDEGGALLLTVEELYGPPAVRPRDQVDDFVRLAEAAQRAGYPGLRVAADPTTMVETPEHLDAFARYEHLLDRALLQHPLTVMCAYDRQRLGNEVVGELACLHPVVNDGASPFSLHATGTPALGLGGDVDIAGADLLGRSLERIDEDDMEGHLTIDARELVFIDHHGLGAIEGHGRRHNVMVELRVGTSKHAQLVERLIDMLGFEHVAATAP